MRKNKIRKEEYALYKDDTFLALGTIKQIAKQMNLKEETIRFYTSKAAKKRKIHFICIKIEGDDEE